MKRFISLLLAVVMVLGVLPMATFADYKTASVTGGQERTLNYMDVDYEVARPTMSSVMSVAASYAQSALSSLSSMSALSALTGEYVPADTLETSYSSVTAGKVRGAQNQGSYGTCWAFSATASSEASFNANGGGLQDLSELQLAYFFYNKKVDPLGNATGDETISVDENCLDRGGNHLFTMWGLANWTTATLDKNLPYTSTYQTKAINGTIDNTYAVGDVAHLQNAFILPYSTSTSDMNNIKQAIKDYGTVSCSYYHSSDYYNSNNGAYYTTSTSSNHAVTIVGWNDNYSKDNFKGSSSSSWWSRWFSSTKPSADGAWLVKNSWGTDWGTDGDADATHSGKEGYFWLSYYDKSIASVGKVFVFDFEAADTYKYNYQYDGSCGISSLGMDAGEKVAAIYQVEGLTAEQESIDAVGFGLSSTNESGKVYVYTGLTDENDPLSGTLAAEESFATTYAGYYTVKLSNPPTVSKGEYFSVVVVPTGDYSIYVDKTYANGDWISFVADTTNDKTYYISTSGTVVDMRKAASNPLTARLKAYTNDATAPVTTYTVTYHADGASNVPAAQKKTEGEKLTLSSTVPTLSGYRFLGWDDKTPATEAKYQPGADYNAEASVDLYALWEEVYTVTYDANGGTGEPAAQTKYKDQDLKLSDTVPTRSGYSFLGWSANKTATSATYLAGDSYTDNASVTLYAVWSAKTVTSMSINPSSKTLDVGGSVTVTLTPNPSDAILNVSAPDYSAEGITVTKNSATSFTIKVDSYVQDQVAVEFADANGAKATCTVTVNKPTYTVTYNANGGTDAPAADQKTHGQPLTLSNTKPTRSGYNFVGWNSDSKATTAQYTAGANYTDNASVTLYAVWEAKKVTSMSINPTAQTLSVGGSVTVTLTPTPSDAVLNVSAPDYSASGITVTKNSAGSFTIKVNQYVQDEVVVEFADANGAKATCTVTVNKPTYTVTYNANGGTGAPAADQKTHGQPLTLSNTKPTRSGYNFVGWNSDSKATTAQYSAGGSYTDNASVTLYAVWTPILATGLTVNPASVSLAVGGSTTVTVSAANSDATVNLSATSVGVGLSVTKGSNGQFTVKVTEYKQSSVSVVFTDSNSGEQVTLTVNVSAPATKSMKVTASVSKSSSKVAYFFTKTTYTATINATPTGTTVKSIAYKTKSNGKYTTLSTSTSDGVTTASFTSTSKISTFYIQVTDADGKTYNYTYKNGSVS